MIILALLVCLVLGSLPTILAYMLFRWLTKKGYKIIGLIILVIVPLLTIYLVYTAIYPTDSFYVDEFANVTLRQFPKTAKIIKKSASYPDFHGDYCSASLINLSREEYLDLFNQIIKDNRFSKAEIIGSDELYHVMDGIKYEQINISFTRQIEGNEDHYLFIGFINDNETIVISVCIT